MPNDNLDMETIETLEEETQQDNSQEEDVTVDPKEKRHAEQLAWSRAEVERLKNLAIDYAHKTASQNIDSLKDLYKQDPKLAKETAERFDWEWSDYWSFQNFLSWKTKNSKEPSQDDDFERKYQERKAQEETQKAEKLIEKLVGKLDDSEQDAVNNYIEKFKKSRMTTDEAKELVEMATLYVNRAKLKEWKKEEILEKMSSTGISSSKKPWEVKTKYVIRNNKMVEITD